MKKGKQPGEFKNQQKRHQERQAFFDALKEMRETGETFCIYKEKKYKILDPRTIDASDFNGKAFVKFGNNIELALITTKNGLHAWAIDDEPLDKISRLSKYIQPCEILAVVYER